MTNKIRQWHEGENLENLLEGDIVELFVRKLEINFYNVYIGLYQGKTPDKKYLFLIRPYLGPTSFKDPNAVVRLKISGEGHLHDRDVLKKHDFVFEFYEEPEYSEYIDKDNPKFVELNKTLHEKGL